MKWISVKERLPERDVRVLTYKPANKRWGMIKMRKETISCDVCGMDKTEGNRWLIAFEVLRVSRKCLAITDWFQQIAQEEGTFHICGEACLSKKIGEYIRQDRLDVRR